MELAAAELEAVQSRLLALETEKNSLAARLEASRQEAAASSEVSQAGAAGRVEASTHRHCGSTCGGNIWYTFSSRLSVWYQPESDCFG